MMPYEIRKTRLMKKRRKQIMGDYIVRTPYITRIHRINVLRGIPNGDSVRYDRIVAIGYNGC